MIPRTRRRRRRRTCRQWKQKTQRAWVNVYDGGGDGIFAGSGYWQRQQWCLQSKTGPRNQKRRQRLRRRNRNKQSVRGIRDNDRGGKSLTTGLRDLQWRRRRRKRKIITDTTTVKTEASKKERRRVQGTGDNNRGVSGLKMGLMNWQRQQSVNFPYHRLANSITVLSLSCCCFILILFSSYPFFCSLREILSVL